MWTQGTNETFLTKKVSQLELGIFLSTQSLDATLCVLERRAPKEVIMLKNTVQNKLIKCIFIRLILIFPRWNNYIFNEISLFHISFVILMVLYAYKYGNVSKIIYFIN